MSNAPRLRGPAPLVDVTLVAGSDFNSAMASLAGDLSNITAIAK